MVRKKMTALQWQIDSVVKKKSGKPFPNGSKVATIIGQCHNPYSGHVAFSFEEFDSPVDCTFVELL